MLDQAKFRELVMNAPLVAIDLVVRNLAQEVLVGFRKNGPAKNTWFVPGGRIWKDEKISAAFRRITIDELGIPFAIETAHFIGVYEHFHKGNFADEPGFGTHYIVLAYEIKSFPASAELPSGQHSNYRWLSEQHLLRDEKVHSYTKDYFRV